MENAKWFLAQLKPNCANVAKKNLMRQGFRTFLPFQEETRQRNGKFINVMQPLFPGYIFVAFDIGSGFWRKINSTHGVTSLVSFGTLPKAVPHELISQLVRRCDTQGKLMSPSFLKPGDRVKLTRGPFANFVAEVENIAPDRRIWVLMEIMGGQTRVAVEVDQLQAI